MSEEISSLVAEFIGLLDKVEESDSGTEFRPNYISSCRVLDGKRLGQILSRLKDLTAT